MKDIHQSLENNVPWYKIWHEYKHHEKFHWGITIVGAVLAIVLILSTQGVFTGVPGSSLQGNTISSQDYAQSQISDRKVARQIAQAKAQGKRFAAKQARKSKKGHHLNPQKSAVFKFASPNELAGAAADADQPETISDQPEAMTVTIPAPTTEGSNSNETITLDLVKVNDDQTSVITQASSTPVNIPQPPHYRGIVSGDDSSLADLTVTDKGIVGFVQHAGVTNIIDTLKPGDEAPGEENSSVIFSLEGNKDPVNYEGDELPKPGSAPVGMNNYKESLTKELLNKFVPTAEANAGDSVKWYWEVDNDVYRDKGTLTATEQYIRGIFNQVQTMYANEGITIELKTLFIWTTTDPYTGPSTIQYLNQFGDYRTSFNGDLAHLIGYYGNGGVAWIGGLCSAPRYEMAYSGISSYYNNYPSYSWTINVMTHEEGHLLGSNHTHDGVWSATGHGSNRIDGCGNYAGYGTSTAPYVDPTSVDANGLPIGGGTIMSYCHLNVGMNFSKGFGLAPRNAMKDFIASSSCLTGPGVIDTTNPSVTLTAPTTGTTISGNVTMSADASDNIGMSRVEFYDGTTLIGSDSSAPYSILNWNTTTVPNGSHTITAKAFDYSGNNASSSATVTISNAPDVIPPTVAITVPSNGSTLIGPLVGIIANATDNIAVTKVEFYDGTALIGTVTASPYQTTWNVSNVASGVHSLTAKAYDAAGNTKVSAVDSVTVSGSAILSATITAPTAGTTISGTVTISASTTGTVDHVDFYRGTSLIGADAVAPYSISWNTTTVAAGTYSLTAKAYSTTSNATSPAISVVVNNVAPPPPTDTTPPTVTLTAPTSGTTVSGSTTVSATASDNVGVTKVEFYRGGTTLIDTDTTSPYAVTWSTSAVANGSYSLTAKAYDAAGNTKISSVSSVTVNNSVGGGSSFSDNFNRSNGAVGNGWNISSGGFIIADNKLAVVAGNNTNLITQPSVGVANQTVSATFTRGNSNSATKFSVLLRYIDKNNYYAATRQMGGSSNTYIEVVQNGTRVKTYYIKNSGGGNTNTGNDTTPFTLRASISGSTLSLTMTKSSGAIYTVTAVDNTFSTGSAGLSVSAGATSDTADDFRVN